jgi:hypothetical protein
LKSISFAGVWNPVDYTQLSKSYNGTIAFGFYGIYRTATESSYGLITTGWNYSGPDKNDNPVKIGVGLLVPKSDGLLKVTDRNLIADSSTNGAGSVVVADFNQDGLDDIFLAAHTEDPMIPLSSAAYIQSRDGRFTKIEISDSIVAHDAKLVHLNGLPAVLTSTFDSSDRSGTKAIVNPIYVFQDGKFKNILANDSWYAVRHGQGRNGTFLENQAMSSELDEFGKDNSLYLVRSDNVTYSTDWSKVLTSDISIYSFNQSGSSGAAIQRIKPYLSTLPQYSAYNSMWGPGLTHVYRVWSNDLNQDGKLDLLAAQSMWNRSSKDWPNALQLLINNGDGTFVDKTATLNSEMFLQTDELSYTPFFIDLDKSGIDTFLFPNHGTSSYERQTNYVLLNDGTGKLYVALHDQFLELARQVSDFVLARQDITELYHVSPPPYGVPITFIPIPNSRGGINFLAEIMAAKKTEFNQQSFLYFNLPFEYTPSSDYQKNVIINDRNESKNIRTWAGNDLIADGNANINETSINGGLGLDSSKYFGNKSDYLVSKSGTSFAVATRLSKQIPPVNDYLTNIERLKFSDVSLALDLDGNAGKAAKVLGAVFGKVALANKEYVGIGLSLLDSGMSYEALAALAVSAAKKSSATDICNLLWTNVIGTTPTAGDIAPFKSMLDSGQLSVGALTTLAADTSYNTTNINLVGLASTGIEYI